MRRVFRKGNEPLKAQAGKHEGRVTVHRGGQVFQRRQMLRDESGSPVGPSRPKQELEAEKKQTQQRQEEADAEFEALMKDVPQSTRKKLNDTAKRISEELKGMSEGDRTKIKVTLKELTLAKMAGGKVKIGGVVAGSLRAATMIAHYLDQAGTTVQETALTGSSGSTDSDTIQAVAQKTEHKTRQKVAKEKGKQARHKDRLANIDEVVESKAERAERRDARKKDLKTGLEEKAQERADIRRERRRERSEIREERKRERQKKRQKKREEEGAK